MNNFTPEDMIRFLYNEMNAEEKSAMQLAMESDWTLREKFEVLKEAVKSLDTLKFSPRPQAIFAIMQYAEDAKVGQP
jgi:hypothetical protein